MTSPSRFIRKFLPSPTELGIVAAGFSGGQQKDGVQNGPDELIGAGLLNQLNGDLNYSLHGDSKRGHYDSVEIPSKDEPHRGMRNPRRVSIVTEAVAQKVYEHAKMGRLVLTLGGDHSLGLATVAGTAKAIRDRLGRTKELGVIWVDSHTDINTPETSPSGNIHGMPVAFLMGLARSNEPNIFDWIDADHIISKKKFVYIALRDVDPTEREALRNNGIKAFSMHEVEHFGIREVVEMALDYIGRDTPIHLGFDIDGLDPWWAPSTGVPVDGGLTLREANYLSRRLHESGQLIAIDLVEVNSNIGSAADVAKTIKSGISVIRHALGDSFL